MEEVMDYEGFVDQLRYIFDGMGDRVVPHGEYLRRLLTAVEENMEQKISGELLLKIFRDSIDAEPATFDVKWDKIDPSCYYDNSNTDDFGSTVNTIKFLIADLGKISKDEIERSRGMGVCSPSGETWYNFDIISIIGAFVSFCDDAMDTDTEFDDRYYFRWMDIADILIIGKGYE